MGQRSDTAPSRVGWSQGLYLADYRRSRHAKGFGDSLRIVASDPEGRELGDEVRRPVHSHQTCATVRQWKFKPLLHSVTP